MRFKSNLQKRTLQGGKNLFIQNQLIYFLQNKNISTFKDAQKYSNLTLKYLSLKCYSLKDIENQNYFQFAFNSCSLRLTLFDSAWLGLYITSINSSNLYIKRFIIFLVTRIKSKMSYNSQYFQEIFRR